MQRQRKLSLGASNSRFRYCSCEAGEMQQMPPELSFRCCLEVCCRGKGPQDCSSSPGVYTLMTRSAPWLHSGHFGRFKCEHSVHSAKWPQGTTTCETGSCRQMTQVPKELLQRRSLSLPERARTSSSLFASRRSSSRVRDRRVSASAVRHLTSSSCSRHFRSSGSLDILRRGS